MNSGVENYDSVLAHGLVSQMVQTSEENAVLA